MAPELVVPEPAVVEPELESGLPDAEVPFPDPLGWEGRTVGSLWVWLRPGSAGLAVAVVEVLSLAGLAFWVTVVAFGSFVVLLAFSGVLTAGLAVVAWCLVVFFEWAGRAWSI